MLEYKGCCWFTGKGKLYIGVTFIYMLRNMEIINQEDSRELGTTVQEAILRNSKRDKKILFEFACIFD